MTHSPRKHEFSPPPSEVLHRFLVWLRGFHKDRERSNAADWAMVVLTALGLIVAVASAVFIYLQLRDGQKNFMLDERAWIELEPIQGTPSFWGEAQRVPIWLNQIQHTTRVGK